jgi:hypothetical protein
VATTREFELPPASPIATSAESPMIAMAVTTSLNAVVLGRLAAATERPIVLVYYVGTTRRGPREETNLAWARAHECPRQPRPSR